VTKNGLFLVKIPSVELYYGVTLPYYEAEAAPLEAIAAAMAETASIELSDKDDNVNFSFASAGGCETMMTQELVSSEENEKRRTQITVRYLCH
jgi:hypothetical protein